MNVNARDLNAVREILIQRASRFDKVEAPITYGELADKVGLPKFNDANWDLHPLSGILGTIDVEDAEARRPFLTALVIRAKERYSGQGFFKAVSNLLFDDVPLPKNEWYAYWKAELDKVLSHYKSVRTAR